MVINIESLIKVIRKHTVLYDYNNKEYYDRLKKKQVWDTVCSQLSSEWDMWDDRQKIIYCKEVQKKWQSLRDCFRRELAVQKTQSSNGKKKYKYFDSLQFLTPYTHCMNNETSSSNNDDRHFLITDHETSSNSRDPLTEAHFHPKRKRSASFTKETVAKDDSHEELGSNSRRFIDDDEAFLFSLLPSFKEYNLEQKYLLRIDLMKTILKFKETQNNLNIVKVEYKEVTEFYS